MCVVCGHGSVLLRQRCDMSRASGFAGDVTFSDNGHTARRVHSKAEIEHDEHNR